MAESYALGDTLRLMACSIEKAYSEIKRKRAEYLMGIAVSDPPHPYKKTAEQVIEALGVHKVDDGNGQKEFAAGAVKLLEEKLGG